MKNGVDANSLIIVEFSRDDYARALKEFFPQFLPNAFFLFIEAEVSTCKQRIKDRVEHPQTPDDHYVSEYIFNTYYSRDMGHYLTSAISKLGDQFDVSGDRCRVIDNTGTRSEESFLKEVDLFVASIFGQSIVAPVCK